MKRFALAGLLAGFVTITPALSAQGFTLADLASARQELEEESRRINTSIEAMQTRQDALDRRLTALGEQVRELRDENAVLREENKRLSQSAVSRDELKQLVDKVNEIERKRADDKKLFLEEIARLGKLPATLAAAEPKSGRGTEKAPKTSDKSGAASGKTDETKATLPSEYYEHKVAANETLDAIIAAYNQAHGLKVKRADVLSANPRVKDPKKLFVGQTLKIPAIK